MFLHQKPSEEVVKQFLSSQRDLPFSYAEVGATKTRAPSGYTIDHNRVQLGRGEETYRRAVAAIQRWQQFELGWAMIQPAAMPLEPGTTVAVLAKVFGFWSLNAARIVYVFDERTDKSRFGFAYGTLPDHVESGEERFTVEWCEDDSVWYDIYAFSRPKHPLVRVGFPVARMLQKSFVKDSLKVMVSAAA